MNKIKDLTNKRFNRLIAIKNTGLKSSNRSFIWLCKCDCGNEINVNSNDLQNDHTKSCGCLHKEQSSKLFIKMNKNRSNPDRELQACKDLYSQYKCVAKKRNLIFNLSLEEFKKLTKQNCFYCNRIPSQIKSKRNNSLYVYNGIDRLDNSIGYEINNCKPCCGKCNKMKNNYDLDDYVSHISTIYKNLKSIGLIM